ncbi:hypothetical protein [Candidatus Poriferisodalis sp.]|uniref:hypothetical protein n=1 Tax=Candidatus Poriferisodalis sp. TaxID=3101277 RepID=UPI003AF97FFC
MENALGAGGAPQYGDVVADDEVPDALPPVGEALDAAFAVQRAALRRVETSQREIQASQCETAEMLAGHSELLLGIAEKVDKLSE